MRTLEAAMLAMVIAWVVGVGLAALTLGLTSVPRWRAIVSTGMNYDGSKTTLYAAAPETPSSVKLGPIDAGTRRFMYAVSPAQRGELDPALTLWKLIPHTGALVHKGTGLCVQRGEDLSANGALFLTDCDARLDTQQFYVSPDGRLSAALATPTCLSGGPAPGPDPKAGFVNYIPSWASYMCGTKNALWTRNWRLE